MSGLGLYYYIYLAKDRVELRQCDDVAPVEARLIFTQSDYKHACQMAVDLAKYKGISLINYVSIS